jgi:hypothetical protein
MEQELNNNINETQPSNEPASGSDQAGASGSDNGSFAPDSGGSSPYDLSKAEKVLFDGKEMSTEELRKGYYRQQDYTKKTQSIAEQKRQFEEERRSYQIEQEKAQSFEENLDIDIDNVLKNPSLEAKFKEIYPVKYHKFLDQALKFTFGDKTSPDYEVRTLKEQFKAIQDNIQTQNMERAKQAFEKQVSQDSEILESAISRLSSKYPKAFEDVVLARAEYLAASIKKDANFNANFTQMLEKLYKENHTEIDNLLKREYKQKVESQKQANTRARDVGKGGGTPAAGPTKLKLKDVKNHILGGMS